MASLYPSSIIEKNHLHETLIEDPKYLKYVDYETIEYDNYEYVEKGKVSRKLLMKIKRKWFAISRKKKMINHTVLSLQFLNIF